MGTRNLTVVVRDNKIKIAQYGQWDGYPGVSGLGCLGILRTDLDNLINGLSNCIEMDEDIYQRMIQHAEDEVGEGNNTPANLKERGMISWIVSEKLNDLYPEQHRNTGFRILKIVADSKVPIYLQSQFEFAADTLFCEWAYVIDLDNGKFETHTGGGGGEQGIFARLGGDTVSMVTSFDLDNLPSDEEYLQAFEG